MVFSSIPTWSLICSPTTFKNIVAKGEIVHDEQFLLPQYFHHDSDLICCRFVVCGKGLKKSSTLKISEQIFWAISLFSSQSAQDATIALLTLYRQHFASNLHESWLEQSSPLNLGSCRCWNFVRIIVMMISRPNSKIGHVWSITR